MTQISIEEYTIKEVDKEILREENYFLLENVIPNVEFVSVCIASNLFTSAFVEDELQVLRSDRDKVCKIISYIPKRGPDAFNKFLDALDKTDQGHVSKRLRKKRAQKSKKTEDGPNSSTWPTELPTIMMKQKFLETFERLQKAVVSDHMEKHSLNTIKFDHIERKVDEVLKSYAALLQDHSYCEKKLHEVGINEDLIEGINSIIQSWKERGKEVQSLKADLRDASDRISEYKDTVDHLTFELKILRQIDRKSVIERQKTDTDLMQKIQKLEKEKNELQEKIEENKKLIKSYENKSICKTCSNPLTTSGDEIKGIRFTPWNPITYPPQKEIEKPPRGSSKTDSPGLSKTETGRKDGVKIKPPANNSNTDSKNAWNSGDLSYGKIHLKSRVPPPTLRPSNKYRVPKHKPTFPQGSLLRGVLMPGSTKPMFPYGLRKDLDSIEQVKIKKRK